jgi:hypothetical protein
MYSLSSYKISVQNIFSSDESFASRFRKGRENKYLRVFK